MTTKGKTRSQKIRECNKWVENNIKDPQINKLISQYWQHSIVLYTGAGVSAGPREPVEGIEYGLPGWIDLLKKVSKTPESEEWPEDPWLAADMAKNACGGYLEFDEKLKKFIQLPVNYIESNGQLAGKFVSHAGTLKAVAAFCGQLTGRIKNPEKDNSTKIHFRSIANPRIQAVLTSNYDCFLESAASNIYRKSPLKPVTALGSQAGSSIRIPVFHIHGYVPHPFYQKKERKQIINELIITKSQYESHWDREDVFGTTMGPQIHYLRYFTVLFIGFSFADEYVRKLLRQIYKDYLFDAGRTHFALLQEKIVKKYGESFFSEMGISPITYDKHEKIPEILGQLYKAGLVTDNIMKGKDPNAKISLPELLVMTHAPLKHNYTYDIEHIWEIMKSCRSESITKGLAKKYESKKKR